ncbi:putative phage tail protein [Methylobacterium sp. A54F]
MALASSTTLTADSARIRLGGPDALAAGWPCAILSATPPSIADRQSNPTGDDLLPAVLALTPRGPAWGTDEAGDGRGASPVMRFFWTAVAKWAADLNARDFALASQVFPSAITTALPDWEQELGLPDACLPSRSAIANRINAVRVRFGAIGGSSPEYMRCLAASVGYDVLVEEPTQAMCDQSECIAPGLVEGFFYADESECDGGGLVEIYALADDCECDWTPVEDSRQLVEREGTRVESYANGAALAFGDEVAGETLEAWGLCDDAACDDTPVEAYDFDPNGTIWKFWVATVTSLGSTTFRVDEAECAFDPIEGFLSANDLECVLRRACPPSTQLIFRYLPTA